jgi:hypothetical protein
METKKMKPQLRNELFQSVYDAAMRAGQEAGDKHTPRPMVVSQHSNPLDDNSTIQEQWIVNSGVCGFAWVIVKPGTSSFARWLVKQGLGGKHYYGGVRIWIGDYRQSYEKKVAHAGAMAKHLQNVGIRAYSDSRLD